MHDYDGCSRNLEDCRWCRMKAEKVLRQNGYDIQELDHRLIFSEQTILQQIREEQDDGVHNECARELLGLDRKRPKSKRKGYPIDIGRFLEGVDYLGGIGVASKDCICMTKDKHEKLSHASQVFKSNSSHCHKGDV